MTPQSIRRRLRHLWLHGSRHRDWYLRAHQEVRALAKRHGIPAPNAAAVVAALSPGKRWEDNISAADTLITAHRSGLPIPMVAVYSRAALDKAIALIDAPVQSLDASFSPRTGPKTRAFYLNLRYPRRNTGVTIDRHAAAAALGLRSKRRGFVSQDGKIPPGLYRELAAHYRAVADESGVLWHELQAGVWCAWREGRT